MTEEVPIQGLYPCEGCPNYGPKVGARGDPNSPLIIIGESPGKHEIADKYHRPFVGPSGKVIDHATRKAEFEPYYINAMMCNPGKREDKDETKMMAACQACRHHVLDEIAKAPRKVILALGTPALWTSLNDYNLKITQQRGKLFPSALASIGVVPSVHPAFLMAGGGGATPQQFFRDVQYAIDLTNGLPPKIPPKIDYEVLSTRQQMRHLARLLTRWGGNVAADIETSALQPLKGRILCLGVAITPGYVYVVPEHLIKYARWLFQNDCNFIWHNGQFDIKWLWHAHIPEARVNEDTILLSYALDENGRIHSLDQVASDWLNSPNWKAVLDAYLPKRDSSYELIPRDVLHKYMAYDIGNTLAIFDKLRPLVKVDKHTEKAYSRTYIPATNYLARVENNGMYVDQKTVADNHTIYEAQLKDLGAQLLAFAAPFPNSGYTDKLPNSHTQLKQLIYDDLGIKKYKNKRSTDRKILEHLSHPVITVLGEYRKVAKEYGTYVKAIPRHIQSDGRVHSSISLFKTRTGRLASNDPNVQNVPRNPTIRGQYVAPKGRRLIEVDLNQAELRILATLSRDPELCRIYLTQGMSLHDEVRASIWGHPKEYTANMLRIQLAKFRLTEANRYDEKGKDLLVAEQKMRAKNVNFGTVYGITAAGLAEQCDCSVPDAQAMLDAWFKKFHVAKGFIESCRMAPFKGQTLITTFGRKKRPGIVSQEKATDIANEFANFPMQSGASDCTVHAGIELEDELRDSYDSHIIDIIHDANLIEAPDDDAICTVVARKMIAKMEEIPRRWGYNVIPFIAEAKWGYRWGSLSETHLKAA